MGANDFAAKIHGSPRFLKENVQKAVSEAMDKARADGLVESKPARKKPKKGINATHLSIKKLEADGWLADVVERRIPGTFITKDLFGFIDILAVRGGECLAVQCTGLSNVSSRVNKIASEALARNVAEVRRCGWSIVVWGWAEPSKGVFTCREVDCS